MPTGSKIVTVVGITVIATLLVFGNHASAAMKKKKVTYDQAWQLCKDKLDKDKVPGTSTQANERHTRGAACMKSYGYKL
ncbi:MAG TPA: hypothetical protein VFB29_01805 [Pseudolabrys sp.]|nr:hypothetical protein [Pseudolabrys sp.]